MRQQQILVAMCIAALFSGTMTTQANSEGAKRIDSGHPFLLVMNGRSRSGK